MTSAEKILYRILDANYNRSKEALRVVEDVLRFSHRPLTLIKTIKKARHQLTRVFLSLPRSFKEIIQCRDIAGDSSKRLSVRDKSGRLKIEDLMLSNLQRVEESVRVLEECTKAIKPAASTQLMRLRFQLYDLEKRIAKIL